ncbi:MAG TPA: ROK family protein [bacterium]|nr:ROK family protein [bacterium]
MRTVIGVDLGGTNIVAAVVDERGRVLGKDKRPTQAPLGAVGVMDRIVESVRAASAASGLPWKSHLRLGIGSPGPLNPKKGIILYTPNLNWKNVHLTEYLGRKTGKKVVLENDANLAALGETWIGAGRGEGFVLCVTLGTGVGGGFILDGKIYEGAWGVSNHIGHVVVDPKGPRAPYGNRGILEQYVSATGIVRLAGLAGLKPPRGEKLEAHTFQKMAERGNAKALRVYDQAGTMLGVGLTSAIHLLNPGMIIFAGGVAAAGELLFKPMRRELKERCFASHLKGLRFRTAKLGDNMGVVGAARLAWQSLGSK